MKKDTVLLAEDKLRKENCEQAMDIMGQEGIHEWKGFSDQETQVIAIRGGGGQVHVGDVFRAVFPTLQYFRAKGIKLVLASSPGLNGLFKGWSDTLQILDASKEPLEIVDGLKTEGVQRIVKWGALHRHWKRHIKHAFDNASTPITRTLPLDVNLENTLRLRQQYSENGQKNVLGIVWRTSMIGRDPSRNATLNDFLPLVNHKPDKWNVVSLQYGSMDITEQEVARFNQKQGTNIIFDGSINPMRDYVGAADQMAACDHIISIDCSQIFQAGAIGVPVSVLLSADPAKQWGEFMENTSNICPFFPETARIFFQKKDAVWDYPVGRALRRATSETRLHGSWSHPAAQRIKHICLENKLV